MGLLDVSLFLLGFLALVMAGAWAVQRLTGNAGWVDAIWSFGTGAAGILAAFSAGVSGRAWLVACMMLLWAARLGGYMARRTARGAKEDVRYARFRVEKGEKFEPFMFGLLMVQAVAAWPLAVAALLAARNPAPIGAWAGALALAIGLTAIAGEGLADKQMHGFRAKPENHGKVCDTGLWGWSRHPNYFFEWFFWLSFPVLAISPFWPIGLGALVAPVIMFWLLTQISGVKMLEREMLASRGAAFAEYQSRVPAFFPLPPKHRSTP